MIVTAGKTDVSVYFYIVQDASGTSPGEPKTALLFSDIETGGSASYMRQGAARTDFALITLASASAAHADGGFILVDDTNLPGVYRCDVPDAAFATGVDEVTVGLVVESTNNAAVSPLKVQILDVDLRDAVSMGITALPAAAADAAGGLAISDAGGLDIDAKLANTNEVTAARMGALTDWIDAGRLDAILDLVLADTGELQADDTPGAIAALNNLSAANVNAEVVDVMRTDVTTLPGQEAPPLTPTMEEMVSWMYKVLRNRTTQTATQWTLYADNETTVDAKATVSDDATTAIVQEIATGP
ncbi:hypothetical protein LCGC14_1712550 [marine sediment metagenome]|uniref:Uncharacterized protein n=1 Tax=marine sediment metagenome TaxID=412755 RepID=A0A0F9KEQ9_9ZZZZ